MAEQMYLCITLRKPVDDRDEARQIYDLVKIKLADRPDIEISGLCTNHFDLKET